MLVVCLNIDQPWHSYIVKPMPFYHFGSFANLLLVQQGRGIVGIHTKGDGRANLSGYRKEAV